MSGNRTIGHLCFELGSNFTSHKPLIQALIHLVTSSIVLGFTSPYTLRTSTSFDLIWCFGVISPVESRSRSPPLLSWAKTTSSEDCLSWRNNHPFGSRGCLGSTSLVAHPSTIHPRFTLEATTSLVITLPPYGTKYHR